MGLAEELQEPSELQQLQDGYSDYHKSIFGFRPRDPITDEQWNSVEWLRAAHAALDQEFDSRMATPRGRLLLRRNGFIVQDPEASPCRMLEVAPEDYPELSRFLRSIGVDGVSQDDSGGFDLTVTFEATQDQFHQALKKAEELLETRMEAYFAPQQLRGA